MVVIALTTSVVFLLLSAWLGVLIRRSTRWWLMGVVGALLASTWTFLLWLRVPRAVDVTFTFILADIAIFALGVLLVMRMLGAWDDPPAARAQPDDDDDDEDGNDRVVGDPRTPTPPPPHPPHPAPRSPHHRAPGPRRPHRPRRVRQSRT